MDEVDRDLLIAQFFMLVAIPLAVIGVLGLIVGLALGSDIIALIGGLCFILLILLFFVDVIWWWFTLVRDFIRDLRKARKG